VCVVASAAAASNDRRAGVRLAAVAAPTAIDGFQAGLCAEIVKMNSVNFVQ